MFNGRLMEFYKNDATQIDRNLLGSLCLNNFSLSTDQNEIELNKEIVPDYSRGLFLFKRSNGTNVIFYVGSESKFNATIFNDDGQVLGLFRNLFHESCVRFTKIANIGNRFMIEADLEYTTAVSNGFFRDQQLSFSSSNQKQYVLVLLDEKLNYVKHVNSSQVRFSANSSNILFCDGCYNFSMLDLNLNQIECIELENLSTSVQVDIVDFVMNDQNVFILNKEGSIQIFNLKTFDLVKTIHIEANGIKLISSNYVCLFSSNNGVFCFYDQKDFEKRKEINLRSLVKKSYKLARDNSKYVSFGDQTCMRWFSIE
jgi:hypothetical protein